MKRLAFLALLPALWLTLDGPAAATAVQVVKIAVIDPRSNQELAVLDPDGTLELPQDEERLLRVFEPPGPNQPERRVVPAEFGFGPSQTALEITRHSVTRGEAVVRLRRNVGTPWPGGGLHVGYRIDDDVEVADRLRLGRVLVQIAPPRQSGQSADQILAALYRGILLRDPDPAAAPRRDDIARNGYAGVLRQAREIAESRESEIDVYQRGSCNQQRLLALHKHLLGQEASQLDQRVWREELERMERGDIGEVVTDLVETRAFQDRFGLRPRNRRR